MTSARERRSATTPSAKLVKKTRATSRSVENALVSHVDLFSTHNIICCRMSQCVCACVSVHSCVCVCVCECACMFMRMRVV